MRGTIFSVLALAVGVALLPAIFEFDGVDGTGTDLAGLLADVVPSILVALVLVAALALLVGWFVGGDGW